MLARPLLVDRGPRSMLVCLLASCLFISGSGFTVRGSVLKVVYFMNLLIPTCAAALTLAALIRRRASLCCSRDRRGPRPPARGRSVDLGC